jgi:GDP-4-dehydro-6-deoxy-D-mannose reductase
MSQVILITGAAGMMGSHLFEKLREAGNTVIATYYNPTIDSRDPILQELTEELNLLDSEAVKRCILKYKPRIIYHLAAQSRPDVSFKDPLLTMQTNVIGTINLLNACIELETLPKIINASSSAVYGDIDWSTPPNEEVTPRPLSPYGTSKLAQEHVVRNYHDMHGIPYVNVRIFNCTGPRKINDLVSDLCRRVVNNEIPIRIGNTSVKRTIVDVRDLVIGLMQCKNISNTTINLGSDTIHDISHVVNLILDGRPYVTDSGLFRPTDEKIIYGNISKAHKLLGWKAEIPLEDTIQDTLKYWTNIIK